ncbi:TPA: EpsG family protein [Streptococcus suis]|nr:EpsG family protein [Streptococcus suis]HEM6082890.1 EpsG family protein [Streptococcus suis]HEM6303067.1 EpsG family protein [Streptococcus suis]
MLIYFLLTVFILLLAFLSTTNVDRKAVTICYILTWIAIFFIIAFRDYSVGSDTLTYISIFLKSPKLVVNWSEFWTSRFELGFLIYNKWLYQFSQHWSTALIGYALPTVIINAYILHKKSVNPFFSTFIFVTYRYLGYSLSSIRPMMAMSLLFLGYYLFENKQKLFGSLALVIALTFHLASIPFIILLLFRNIRLSKKLMATCSLVSIFLFLLIENIFRGLLDVFEKYTYYENSVLQDSAKLGSLLNFLVLFLIFLFGEWIRFVNDEKNEVDSLRTMCFFGLVIAFAGIKITVFDRILGSFAILSLLYLPYVLSKIKSNDWRIISYLIVTIGFCLYFFIILIFRPEWNYIVPYQNILF